MADDTKGTLVITDVHPAVDGEYEMDFALDAMNGEEAHLIKEISGVRINELEDALAAGDYDLILAYASVALLRNGKKIPIEVLRAAPLGSVAVKDEEVEEVPPSPSVPLPTLDEERQSSGSDSRNNSGDLATTPLPGGDPGSVTGFPA